MVNQDIIQNIKKQEDSERKIFIRLPLNKNRVVISLIL
jgi:hypothetical protein